MMYQHICVLSFGVFKFHHAEKLVGLYFLNTSSLNCVKMSMHHHDCYVHVIQVHLLGQWNFILNYLNVNTVN